MTHKVWEWHTFQYPRDSGTDNGRGFITDTEAFEQSLCGQRWRDTATECLQTNTRHSNDPVHNPNHTSPY